MMSERIYLASPHMGGSERRYVDLAFDTNWIAPLGANVTGFEQDLQQYLGAGYVTALSAGTAALHLAVRLAGVQRGDRVFCQSLTFSASANPIVYEGGEPVFLDSEPDTWNLDPETVEAAIARFGAPKALIAVHLYGMPGKLDAIRSLCDAHGILLIEDAAEALGSVYHGQKCGTFGHYGVLSFNGNKIITTSGGGALVCRDEADAQHALKMATQAREPVAWYEHTELGYNYRMSNICAGIGRGQMEVLEQRVAQKRAIHDRYCDALAGLPLQLPAEPGDVRSNRWLTAALLVRQKLGSPVIFHQDRPGKDEQIFRLYKFRTMTDARGADGELLPDAQRLTPFGRRLRSTSLDELPELWNILRGDMSIVGPRPLLVKYLPYYTAEERRRHAVRPGLTGLAQVNGRNALRWEDRFVYDVDYVDHISFALDAKIVLMTLRCVFSREGISAEGSATMEAFTGTAKHPEEVQ